MIDIACVGDLVVDSTVFGGPVLVLGGWLAWTTMRSRRDQTSAG